VNLSGPRISVLLPVYNGAAYLAQAIESVLSQSFTDFEFLILNDGSTDNSADIVQSYQDNRIRYFEHPNMGLPATLNKGFSHARGEFLVRQDQDDLSYSNRFARQVAYLDAHPEVDVLGTWARIFIDSDSTAAYRYHRHPTTHAAIALSTIFDSAFVHSSVAMRHSAFEALGGYSCDPMYQPPEDFELWSRVCRHYQVANIPEVLIDYREVPGSMSRALCQDFTERMERVSEENLRYWLDGSPYVSFSVKLSRIYYRDGKLPTDAADGAMIHAVLNYIGKSISTSGSIDFNEYSQQLRRIRLQFMRNYHLGRSRNMVSHLVVKIVFRLLRAI